MTRNIVALSALVLLAAGCQPRNQGIIRGEMVRGPELGVIYVCFGTIDSKRVGPYALWERPDGSRQAMDTLILTNGSPSHGLNLIPENEERRQYISPDGKRAWVEKDGKILASFDLEAGVANLSLVGHPSWATTQPTGP